MVGELFRFYYYNNIHFFSRWLNRLRRGKKCSITIIYDDAVVRDNNNNITETV
jgi:hypothetical protein